MPLLSHVFPQNKRFSKLCPLLVVSRRWSPKPHADTNTRHRHPTPTHTHTTMAVSLAAFCADVDCCFPRHHWTIVADGQQEDPLLLDW